MIRRVAVALLVAVCPAAAHAQRTQLEVRMAGAPASVLTRLQSAYADAQFPIDQAEGTRIVGEVPLTKRDMGGRAGTRALVQAVVLPIAADSARVVLTGRMEVPQAGRLPAQTMAVSDKRHREYGKTNQQAWAALEQIAAALMASETPR